MHQGDNQVGPVNAVDIAKHAFTLAGRHAAVVFGTSLIVQAAVLAVSFVAMNTLGMAGFLVWMLLMMASYQVSMGIYTLFLLHLRHGHPMPSALYLLKESAPLVLPLLWLGVLSTLGIFVGFLCFFVPGVILSLRWAVAAPALVAKRVPAVEALSISRHVTAGNYGTVFALGAIQGLIANVLPQVLMGSNPTMAPENLIIIQGVFAAICTPIVALASAELFLRLARVPNRLDADAPLGGAPAPAPDGPWVPLGAPAPAAATAGPYVPLGAPAQAHPYAAPPAPAHAYVAPPAPTHAYGAAATTPANAYGAPATHAQPFGAPVHAASSPANPAHAVPAHMYAANAQPQAQAQAYAPPPQAYATAPQAQPAPAQVYAAAPQAQPQPYAAPPQPPVAPAQPYAAAAQSPSAFVPPTQAHVVATAQVYGAAPVAPQPHAAPAQPAPAPAQAAAPAPAPPAYPSPVGAPAAPFQPAPGLAGPPVVADRAQSVGPPGMG